MFREWSASELHVETVPDELCDKPEMATSLALEGLESYEPACHGDTRVVTALNTTFVYIEPIKGWVEIA